MARAYASTILDAPVEAVWSAIRDFNGLPGWHPVIARSEIEDGLDADVVGCIRRFWLQDGAQVRERLLSFSDRDYCFSYNFETPAFPVENYVATRAPDARHRHRPDLRRVGSDLRRGAGGQGQVRRHHLQRRLPGRLGRAARRRSPDGRRRPERSAGQASRRTRCGRSTVIDGSADAVWKVIRDFAGMGGWHDAITKMHMIGGARSDKVSGTRDFFFGEGHLNEKLLHLDDVGAQLLLLHHQMRHPLDALCQRPPPLAGDGRQPHLRRCGRAIGWPRRRTTWR